MHLTHRSLVVYDVFLLMSFTRNPLLWFESCRLSTAKRFQKALIKLSIGHTYVSLLFTVRDIIDD
jgi:hypothetical protein